MGRYNMNKTGIVSSSSFKLGLLSNFTELALANQNEHIIDSTNQGRTGENPFNLHSLSRALTGT